MSMTTEHTELDAAFLEAQLKDLYDLRDAIRTLQQKERQISEHYKRFLEQHPGEELVDGEHRIVARLQERNAHESYDVTAMPTELVLRLHQARCLDVDVRVLRALSGKDLLPEDCRPYRIPGGVTYALIVEKKE